MTLNLTESCWEEELSQKHLTPLTESKLTTAIRAIKGQGRLPSVTLEEFNEIVDEVFFVRLGKIGYILKRNKSGILCLNDEEAKSRGPRKPKEPKVHA